MSDMPEEDEQDGMEETEEAAKLTDRIVNVTVDFMRVAERVLAEFQQGDDEFSTPEEEDGDEGPSIMEISCVAQMIMSGTMAGVYRIPEKAKTQKSVVQELFEKIAPLIESQVSLAVSKVRLRETPATPMVLPPPPPPPLPVVPSLFDRIIEKIYTDLEYCGCFSKAGKLCPECVKRDVVREVIGSYMEKDQQ